VIPLELFETIRLWRELGVPRREIARRTQLDRKTVNRAIKKIEAGATAPFRSSPGSKLAPFLERITEAVVAGRTAQSIYEELSRDPSFPGSCYDLVKRTARAIRENGAKEPRVFERLAHPPGAEAQFDFGELVRVPHLGKEVRTWAFVMIWPHSRWRYEVAVLDQTVPTLLGCIQSAIIASGCIPERLSEDNLLSAVLHRQMGIRPYQRDFANFCAHYGMMPNAVRPRTPTDKGAVENSVGVLKKSLRGRKFGSFNELYEAVGQHMALYNDREHSVTGRRPNDLLPLERRGPLPDPYPLALWAECRVRNDIHVCVLKNFYSVPYTLAGKKVVVSIDDSWILIYHDLELVARHERCFERGQTFTNREHYPSHKRLSSQEIHAQRVARIRGIGPAAGEFLAGLFRTREYVHSDLYRMLLRLIERHDALSMEQAFQRAVHFGNYDIGSLQEIVERRLFELPLDEFELPPTTMPRELEIARPLDVYTKLYGGVQC
jgi:transposase